MFAAGRDSGRGVKGRQTAFWGLTRACARGMSFERGAPFVLRRRCTLSLSNVVGYLMNIALILIHTLGHHPDTQPESQDKIFQRRGTVDLMLGLDQFGEPG